MNKKINEIDLSPDRIRAIRERLGLSQKEAGEVIGGGPRAFTKYESGTVKPTAAVVNFLKILEQNPDLLSGKKTSGSGRSPFEVEEKHVVALSPEQLKNLVRRLLAAEAFSYDIPADGIHVADNITAPDGGIDAEFKWTNSCERTRFLPCRLNGFQLKSGKISAAGSAKEVLQKDGNIKDMVRTILQDDGTYVLLCAHSYTADLIREREAAIRYSIKSAGLSIRDEQIAFRDAGQIAEWVNVHPSVAIWVLENAGFKDVHALRTWEWWSGCPSHRVKWIADPRLAEIQEKLLPSISATGGVARVIGPSGVGKSRLIIKALENANTASFSKDLTLYADGGDDINAIKRAVQSLAESGTRCIIIVDRCDIHMHGDLANLVKRKNSNLSLITIDDQPPFDDRDGIIIVRPLAKQDTSVIDNILKEVAPGLDSEDYRRLAQFSAGFPSVAVLLGQSWAEGIRTATIDAELAKAIIIGRDTTETDDLLRGARILSVFGLIYESEIEIAAKEAHSLTPEALRTAIGKLQRRGIVQKKGKAFMIQPRPVALCLAAEQWNSWGKDHWDSVITGSMPEGLKQRAIDQLALMNTIPAGLEIGRYLLRHRGPLASLESLSCFGQAAIFSRLSEVDTEAAVLLLMKIREGLSIDDIREITGDTRRHIIWALDKICFAENTFERGANLMLDFAVAENESWGNNATGQFKSFFPVQLGDTAAGAEERLRVLNDGIKEATEAADNKKLFIIIEALLSGIELNHFSRSVGAETHGSKPALRSWTPKTWKDLWDYVEKCCNLLIELAKRTDEVGKAAKEGLGQRFRPLALRAPLFHVVEKAVKEITAAHGAYWPAAYEGLGDILAHDKEGLDPEIQNKVQKLIETLSPQTLEDRIRFLVMEMPWDYPCDEKTSFEDRGKKQREAVENLVTDLLRQPEEINKFIPIINDLPAGNCRGQMRMASTFGQALAEKSTDPVMWLDPIVNSLKNIQPENRDFEMLSGYIAALAKEKPEIVEKFKREISSSVELARALPPICWRMDMQASDVSLACSALQAEFIKPYDLRQWSCGGVLAKSLSPSELSPLLDQLISMGEGGFSVGVELMGMYAHGRRDILSELMPQIKLAAEKVSTRQERGGSQMDEHHFQEIMTWVLKRGKTDPDARAVVLILTNYLLESVKRRDKEIMKPLLPLLLSDFPEITWPHIGRAIVSAKEDSWRLGHLFGDAYSFGEMKNPAILQLPENMLFAWCHEYPEIAPAFVAGIVPVLTSQNPGDVVRTCHPIMKRILDEFGERDDVLDSIRANIGTYSWSGPRSGYYALYEQPLKELENHPTKKVRVWVQEMIRSLNLEKNAAIDEHDEQEAHWAV